MSVVLLFSFKTPLYEDTLEVFLFGSVHSPFGIRMDFFLLYHEQHARKMGSLWLARAQWLPSDDLFMWLACVWYATEPSSEKQWLESKPGSNVCRCIPNWGIAFLVIAISICALLSLLSHFKLSLISLSCFPLSSLSLSHTRTHLLVLRHTHRVWCLLLSPSALSPPPPRFFTLLDSHWFGAWTCGCSTHSVVACEKLAERRLYILIIAPSHICCGRSDINMHRCAIMYRCDRTPSINNSIKHNAKRQCYWQEPRCVQ